MKYLPAFNINAPGVYEALRAGRLHLQPGQWVFCDDNDDCTPSRFVDASQGYINVVHPTGAFCTGPFPVNVFQKRIAARRHRKAA